MGSVQQRAASVAEGGHSAVYSAWERFVQGEDDVRDVRPEIAISWHRCRDEYGVDPYQPSAPEAVGGVTHSLEHDVVFAELGFRAAAMAQELANAGGVVLIADATGRVLAEWGDKATCSMAASAGLAPWHCWSESAAGTNGMGTALGSLHPVVIRREEHWCAAFHEWTCAGVAVRDVVSKEPIAVLNISSWREELPSGARGWLMNAASHTQSRLRRQARVGGAELVAAFHHARSGLKAPLAAVDTAGKVVIADDEASVLLGVPANTPAVEPAVRWVPGLPSFTQAAKVATTQAGHCRDWVGSTQILTHLASEPSPIGIRPVFLRSSLVGHLIHFGPVDGETLPLPEAPAQPASPSRGGRVVGVRDNRLVLLRRAEILYAESAGNEAVLVTDQGSLRSSSPGLDRLEQDLVDTDFMRVHRQYIVNLNRVREVERGERGEIALVMDHPEATTVPVSRRNARAVRVALGI